MFVKRPEASAKICKILRVASRSILVGLMNAASSSA
jgi:hypothetical protein